jgi:hypothetical protein
VQPDSARPGLIAALLMQCALPICLPAQGLPAWVIDPPAKDSLGRLWAESISANREHVGCLGGTLGPDTVRVERVILLDAAPGDSLNAPAELSLATCAPPQWIGTVHTHVRSTDDPSPAPRFSGGDRVVMSVWSGKWRSRGAFCVLYSDRGAHCEVYPPGRSLIPPPPGSNE